MSIHKETYELLGLGRSSKMKEINYCKCHPMEMKSISYEWKFEGSTFRNTVKKEVPTPVGKKSLLSTPNSINKGVSYDRLKCREIKTSKCNNPESLG